MAALSELFKGAQDAYIQNKHQSLTFQTKFVETRKQTIRFEKPLSPPPPPEEIQAEFDEIHSRFLRDPDAYLDEYYELKQKYLDYLPALLNPKPKAKASERVEIDNENDPQDYGYTGLRITGNPSAIESICLEIGGQQMDKIYPSITGTFDSIYIFNAVIPRPIYHKICLQIKFVNQDTELSVEWDVVQISRVESPPDEIKKSYDLVTKSTQYIGREEIRKGDSKVGLSFNHPLENLKIFTKEPVENMILSLNSTYQMYIPYKGKQNDKYVYEYHFISPVNFSRIDHPSLLLSSATDNTVDVFATSWNVVRFMMGMAGLAFSK